MTSVRQRATAAAVPVWLDLGDGTAEPGRQAALAAGHRIAGAAVGPDATVTAARKACDDFRGLHEETLGRRGIVVLGAEVFPERGTSELVHRAGSLADGTDRPNTAVALPSNDAGLAAMGVLLDRGLPVQLATCFSARRYEQAAAVYLAALERAVAEGRDPGRLASTVAFGLRPLDIRVDALLDRAGSAEAKALRGTAALTAARLAHATFARLFDPARSPAWRTLAAGGARPLRLVWSELGDSAAGAAEHRTRYTAGLATADTAVAVPLGALGTVAGLRPRLRPPHGARAAAEHLDACLSWFGIGAREVARELEGEPAQLRAQARTLVRGGVA
ncbi:transaldolase family protein [Streptomyces sp. NPDC102402]|uniref:transaldolase family protein n=1 Tax=Streptomyces sp. NPDC102402 TaxID=3366169 RepID=UPI0038275672